MVIEPFLSTGVTRDDLNTSGKTPWFIHRLISTQLSLQTKHKRLWKDCSGYLLKLGVYVLITKDWHLKITLDYALKKSEMFPFQNFTEHWLYLQTERKKIKLVTTVNVFFFFKIILICRLKHRESALSIYTLVNAVNCMNMYSVGLTYRPLLKTIFRGLFLKSDK